MVDVVLRGPRFLDAGVAPVLLQRTDARFMSAVREELLESTRWTELKRTITAPAAGASFTLFQPTHRTFHLALVSAACNEPGTPPLARKKIRSCGLVIRRIGANGLHERWVTRADGTKEWEALRSADERDQDPDPVLRRAASAGHPELDRMLARRRALPAPGTEAVAPLFPLPRGAMEATGESLLYGLVPTVSPDSTAAPPTEPLRREELIEDGFPDYLKAGAGFVNVPAPGASVTQADLRTDAQLRLYADFLQRLVIMYDWLGVGHAAKQLRALLGPHVLPLQGGRSQSALEHLDAAARALVLGETQANGQPLSVEMPLRWPRVSKDLESLLFNAIASTIQARHAELARESGRFAARDAQYVLRSFMRVQHDPECPPKLVWSEATPPFRIAPWYVRGPAPMPVIQLPDTVNGFAGMLPNVAFEVPAAIANLLRSNSPDDFLNGKAKAGASSGIQWICSFNIPIITLCAFIVLSIFLSLLNIVFWWLPFIKICLPVPKRP